MDASGANNCDTTSALRKTAAIRDLNRGKDASCGGIGTNYAFQLRWGLMFASVPPCDRARLLPETDHFSINESRRRLRLRLGGGERTKAQSTTCLCYFHARCDVPASGCDVPESHSFPVRMPRSPLVAELARHFWPGGNERGPGGSKRNAWVDRRTTLRSRYLTYVPTWII